MEAGEIKTKVEEMFFDATDARQTINTHRLRHFKRVHGGTDNEETLGDLIDSLVQAIIEIEKALKGGE